MNETDLITRYRPKDWNEFIGNDATVKSLMDSVDTNNAHQYLLVGPSGCGKTTAARIMAKEFGCDNPFELDAAANNSVDDMRSIIEELRYKMVLGGKNKVYIIDECHSLSRSAWNSILKSVEEPPEYVYWIFCTTDVGRVLPTIKTRCFTAEFKPLPIDDLYNLVEQICIKEEFKTEDTIIAICAEQANGSPRQAIANLAKCWNVKDEKDAYELLKAVGENSDVVELIKALMEAKPWPVVLKIINKLEEPNAESVRRVAQAYLTKVILNTEKEDRVKVLFPILDAFSTPFRDEGMAPLVLACGGILFGH